MSRFEIRRTTITGWLRLGAVAFAGAALIALPEAAQAGPIALQALTSFSGDGWLSPTEAGGTLNVTNQVRSLAFDPSTSTLLIPSGANTIQRINASTGAFQGTTFTNTGVTGGAVSLNTVAATSDGVIYGSNLTTNSGASPFKIYRWTSDSSAPTVAYTGNAGFANVRVGDDIAITGADASGLLGFGYGAGATSGTFVGASGNGFATVSTGAVGSATGVQPITGSPTLATGQFRLGMAFVNSSSVIGTQNSSILANATFSGASGSVASSVTLTDGGSQRGVAYGSAYGTPLLATIDTGNNGVRLFDATSLAAPTLLSTLNLTTSAASNGNGTAQLVFGSVGGQPMLYALNSNNGIQAFQIVPEPSTTAVVAVSTAGLVALMLRRRRNEE